MTDQDIIDTIAEWLGEVYGWCQECGIGQSDNRAESAQGIAAALRERYAIVELGEADGMWMEDMNIGDPATARFIAAALLAEAATAEADQ